MAALTGNKRKDTYKDLIQISNSNSGIDATLRAIEDGEGTSSVLYLSTTAVEVRGAFQLGVGGTIDLDGKELILDADADTSITADTDDQIDIRIAASDVGRWDASGLIVGTASVAADGPLHIWSGSAGTVTGAGDLIIEDTTGATIQMLCNATNGEAGIHFGDPDDIDVGRLTYHMSDDSLRVTIGGAAHSQFSGLTYFLGDTANANMTQGITINQGANTDEALALKQSSVAHGITGIAETDTYLAFRALGGANGIGAIQGFGDVGQNPGMVVEGYSDTVDTAAATTGVSGLVRVGGYQTSGTGKTDATANALVFQVLTRKGAAEQSIFFVDEDGDLFVDGSTTPTAFDAFDDAALVRAFDVVRAPNQVIRSTWDDHVRYNEQSLVDAGILSCSVNDGGMVNVTQLQRLHNGAIWQLYTQLRETQERLAAAEQKLLN